MQENLDKLIELAHAVGHRFNDISLLSTALNHPSHVHEVQREGLVSNQRLEFLGDAVLELAVSEILYAGFPEADEGSLSKARSVVVKAGTLARVAVRLNLGDYLLLGRGEEAQGGRDKPSLLADAMEAVFAAVYLDGGWRAAAGVVKKLMGPELASDLVAPNRGKDPKTRLQETAQQALHATPRYHLLGAEGPDHDKVFKVAVEVAGKTLATGQGKSKKEAEKEAARVGLAAWEPTDNPEPRKGKMLDPAKPTPINLQDFATYLAGCLRLAEQRLDGFASVEEVAAAEDQLNKHPRLESLEEPRDLVVLDDAFIGPAEGQAAKDALLEGRVLLEHACAGEATRLGLGTKYLVNPALDLTDQVMAGLVGEMELAVKPADLTPLSLGARHMLQLAWDLSALAREAGEDPAEVLARQWLLVIVNEKTGEDVLRDFLASRFYGFAPEKVLFMVQRSFHGLAREDGAWRYDRRSPRRLHNHGQMLMQTTMSGQVFRLDQLGQREPLSWPEHRELLARFDDKVSFNIEDLDYLDMALDLTGLAAALKLGEQGYRMVMEVVGNHPDNPQKGGMCAWDPELAKNVMIESFQLAGLPNERITHLNKNINHYPEPVEALSAVHENGLSMPIAVKKGFLYFQPIQGDVNFLVKTAFVRRPTVHPISAWKSGANTPAALVAMKKQDDRPGFLAWAAELTGKSFL